MSGNCRICNRPLTSNISIEKGIGSDCAKLVGVYTGDSTIDLNTYPSIKDPASIVDSSERNKAIEMRVIEKQIALKRGEKKAKKWHGTVSRIKGEEGSRYFTATSNNNSKMDGFELIARAQTYAENAKFVDERTKLLPINVTKKSGRVIMTFAQKNQPEYPCLRMTMKEQEGSVKYFFNELEVPKNEEDMQDISGTSHWMNEDISASSPTSSGTPEHRNIFEWACGWMVENGKGR